MNRTSTDMTNDEIRMQLSSFQGKSDKTIVISYSEAIRRVKEKIKDKNIIFKKEIVNSKGEKSEERVIKDKKYFKEKMAWMQDQIRNIVVDADWRVDGYENHKANLINIRIAEDTSCYYYNNEYSTDDESLWNEEDLAVEKVEKNPKRVKKWNNIKSNRSKTIQDLINELTADISGLRALTPLFNDPLVSDIFVLKWNLIFVERDGVNRLYRGTFLDEKDYDDFLGHYLREDDKDVGSGANKIVDFEVYGNRGSAVHKTIANKGTILTIRIHPESHVTLQQIINKKGMSEEMVEFFRLILKGEANLIYAGLTGSGKTTSLRALIDYTLPKLRKRALVCEDTPELFLENPHTVEFVSFKHKEKELEVSLQQVIYTALRQKPKYIIVGEVRAEEACAAVEGMETGHSTIFSMHGGKPINCINRIVTKYLMAMPSLGIEVVERIMGEAVDYIAIQDNIPGIGRKVTSITEVFYDYEKRTVGLKTIFKYNFSNNEMERVSGISKDIADKLMARGVKLKELTDGKYYDWTDANDYRENEESRENYENHIIS